MRLKLYASFWKDDRLHEMILMDVTIDQLKLLMKYSGSEWKDSIDIGPLDVSAITSLTLRLVCNDTGE